MNLILLEHHELNGAIAVLRDGRARHLVSVLRTAPDRRVRIGLVDGPLGTGLVVGTSDGSVTLDCAFDELPPEPAVDLLLALPRPKVLRRLWAQIAAVGVRRVILTNAERVERNYFDTHLLDEDTYRPLLLEGLQQARDTRVPRVTVHRQFRKLVEDELDSLLSDGSHRLVAEPGAPDSVIGTLASLPARVLMAVGPEGGWNAFELGLFRSRGFRSVGLGLRPLRSDTACIALLALAHEAMRAQPPATGGAEHRASTRPGTDRI